MSEVLRQYAERTLSFRAEPHLHRCDYGGIGYPHLDGVTIFTFPLLPAVCVSKNLLMTCQQTVGSK